LLDHHLARDLLRLLRAAMRIGIYNHRALRAEFEGRGRRFRRSSDAEVIPHLYVERRRDDRREPWALLVLQLRVEATAARWSAGGRASGRAMGSAGHAFVVGW
jgi:hypothetical protein